MANVTMEMIKELRERTAAGVVDCKKVLTEMDGNIEDAVLELQKRGIAKAAKKQGRIAAEGKVGMYSTQDGTIAALMEINCETDFVSRGEGFVALCADMARQVAEKNPTVVEGEAGALADQPFMKDDSITVGQAITNFTAATGEKTTLRRFVRFETAKGRIGAYVHDGGRICVLADIACDDESLVGTDEFSQACEDVAMHVAAMNPPYVRVEEIPAADVERQEEIFTAQVKEEGKPDAIAPKIVAGKVAKWKKENCLVDQLFVKDTDTTVGNMVSALGGGATIVKFARFEVGEGLQKRVHDLAAEVAEIAG